MDDKAHPHSTWSLKHSIARIASGAFTGEINVSRPQLGLRQEKLDDRNVACTFFCTQRSFNERSADIQKRSSDSDAWPLAIAEAYTRGNDLVATYQPSEGWPYSPQLYWQANTLQMVEGVQSSLSHLVSVQTHLLNTRPEIKVASQVPSDELLFLTASERGTAEVEPVSKASTRVPTGLVSCALWRLAAAPVSYIEIAASGDIHEISTVCNGNGSRSVEWLLFAEFLEKGVIRRARIHAALVPRAVDTELAIECCRAIERCSLPLTT